MTGSIVESIKQILGLVYTSFQNVDIGPVYARVKKKIRHSPALY